MKTLTILAALASMQSHGWRDVDRSYESMERSMAANHHVYVPCGVVSILAKRALERNGLKARLVGTFRAPSKSAGFLDVPAGVIESHAMVEVYLDGRWALFDVDANVQPLDRHYRPVTLLQFVRQRRHYYRQLANDRLYSPIGSPNPRYERWLFGHVEQWRNRVRDIPAVMFEGNSFYTYWGSELLPFPGYRHG